jgi:hypothetical protein
MNVVFHSTKVHYTEIVQYHVTSMYTEEECYLEQ